MLLDRIKLIALHTKTTGLHEGNQHQRPVGISGYSVATKKVTTVDDL